MRVFVSWSGETSQAVAGALKNWLPDVLQQIKPWMSSSDLEAGLRSMGEIGKSLESTDFGIICLTPENLEAPWILFEAGALSKRFESARVLPYLFRLEQGNITGPLAQFQNVLANKEGTRKLVGALYSSLPDPSLDANRMERAFEKWWPMLETRLAAIPEPDPNEVMRELPSEQTLLNEILGIVRGLQRQVSQIERMNAQEKTNIETLRVPTNFSGRYEPDPPNFNAISTEQILKIFNATRQAAEQAENLDSQLANSKTEDD